MIRRTSKLPLRLRVASFFSTENEDKTTRVETVGFKNNTVRDFNKIAFEPKEPLQFVNGKCLVYKHKRSLAEIILRGSFYFVPTTSIASLIYLNPWADVFPASIPIMVILELLLVKLWLNRVRWNQNLVSEIYLLENGEATEIHFSNKTKRRLFGEPLKKIYYNTIFVTPDFEKEEIMVMQKNNFPESLQGANMEGYSWTKHFSNGENFFLLPKNAEMNLELLIQIFKGKVIKNPPE